MGDNSPSTSTYVPPDAMAASVFSDLVYHSSGENITPPPGWSVVATTYDSQTGYYVEAWGKTTDANGNSLPTGTYSEIMQVNRGTVIGTAATVDPNNPPQLHSVSRGGMIGNHRKKTKMFYSNLLEFCVGPRSWEYFRCVVRGGLVSVVIIMTISSAVMASEDGSFENCPEIDLEKLGVYPPHNPDDILNNFNILYKEKLLLEVGIYKKRYLKDLFGGSKVEVDIIDKNNALIYVQNIGEIFENSAQYPGLGASIVVSMIGDAENPCRSTIVRAAAAMDTAHDTRLTADVVERVFGPAPEISNPYKNDNPKHPHMLMPKTHPLGNLALSYSLEDSRMANHTSFYINGDGTVNYFNLIQENVP